MIVKKLDQVPSQIVEMEGVLGASRQLVLGSPDGVPNFSLRVFTLEVGGHTPQHHHTSEHLNYVISGQGVLVDPEGVERSLAAGDFAFVAPNELHQFRNAGDEPFRFICAVPKQYE